MTVAKLISNFKKRLADDSLFRNSIYLMGSTFVVAASGLLYWVLAAHLYQAKAVGLAATLISVSNVVLLLSMMGYDNSFIRFLPKAKNPSEQIDTGFTVAIIAAVVTSLIYLAAIYLFVPGLDVVTSSLYWMGFFVLFMVVSMLNYLSNYPFIAYRITHIVLIINTGMGTLRLLLILVFAGFGLNGLLLSNIIALAAALVATLYFMRLKMNYVFHFRINWRGLKEMWKYSFNSYLSTAFLMLPAYILPTLVVGKLGVVSSGYYYIVAMIIAALNVVPQATSQSLFAEGAWNENALRHHLTRAAKIVFILTLPAVLVLVAGGKLILSIFGSGYADAGYTLIVLLSISGLFKAGSYLFSTILRIEHQVGWAAAIYGLYAVVLLAGSYVGLHSGRGLASIGWATLAAEILTVILFAVAYRVLPGRRSANKLGTEEAPASGVNL